MSFSYTATDTATFTVTHARHIASKVATDLKRMQRFYGQPSDYKINDFEAEVIEFLRAGYLGTVTYGYCQNDRWIEPTLKYSAHDLADGSVDDDPGRILPGANVDNASFHSYLTYSSKWYALSQKEKDDFKARLPFKRSTATEPTVNGRIDVDKTYSAAGTSLSRSYVRNSQ
ncbi:MAG: hypothetical protein DCF25_02260 [Leptolyngbya foveolarum]|uniref:Bacterial HORMA domain-containing protein n=1 Tax=Leptolyngbya foveolarum TaxID=47253 RepID=A0A2W4UTQ3_9CYAN|nr:MAG: hypothetical protein DCF25_02260 [Leptolyngbya foveolarum]